jgi:UPF0271 protein
MKGGYIDINCDLGEGFPFDAELMALISSCNIACGGHIGNEASIRETILLAKKYDVKIGAHPSYPDQDNFGRKIMDIRLDDLGVHIKNQLLLFKQVAVNCEAKVHHIKPHGALYNLAAKNEDIADCFLRATKSVYNNCFIYAPYNSVLATRAKTFNLDVKFEAFADRNYNDDLSLVARNLEAALLEKEEEVAAHVLHIIKHQKVMTINKNKVHLLADTFCVHGDTKNALSLVENLKKSLSLNAIKVQ